MQRLLKSGLDGVVCSTHEVPSIRKAAGEDFLTVTPGIRMGADSVDDQVRVATPQLAREYGSSAIVVGRSITKAKDPLKAYYEMLQQWKGAYYAMTKLRKEIAKQLIDIEAVSLQPNDPFTWASGIKSPIYCDNRLTLSYPKVRKEIAKGLQHLIKTYFANAEVIAGTATAGIPHAAWVSEALELPMCYVRSKAKEHGQGNQIEGKVTKGQKVVVIEDLISTGGSVFTAVDALKAQGCEVLGVVSIFTYELEKRVSCLKKRTSSLFFNRLLYASRGGKRSGIH